MFLTGTGSYYLAVWQIYPDLKTFAGISSLMFIPLFFAHSLFSVYLFGFPKFKRQIRVVHHYIGYVLFVFTLVSNSLIGLEPYHVIAYFIMWAFLIAHISLSIRFFSGGYSCCTLLFSFLLFFLGQQFTGSGLGLCFFSA